MNDRSMEKKPWITKSISKVVNEKYYKETFKHQLFTELRVTNSRFNTNFMLKKTKNKDTNKTNKAPDNK